MVAALDLDFLAFMPPFFLYLGLVAWATASTGFIVDLLRRLSALPSLHRTDVK
ncbi:MAG: hypothetical protein NDJ19_03980 [Ramlibacter sp.]|nr:hypothetical protein [Ramlibacter sp.]